MSSELLEVSFFIYSANEGFCMVFIPDGYCKAEPTLTVSLSFQHCTVCSPLTPFFCFYTQHRPPFACFCCHSFAAYPPSGVLTFACFVRQSPHEPCDWRRAERFVCDPLREVFLYLYPVLLKYCNTNLLFGLALKKLFAHFLWIFQLWAIAF